MTKYADADSPHSLPVPPVERWLAPLTHSPAADWFAGIWKRVFLSIGGVTLAGDVGHLIVNEGGRSARSRDRW